MNIFDNYQKNSNAITLKLPLKENEAKENRLKEKEKLSTYQMFQMTRKGKDKNFASENSSSKKTKMNFNLMKSILGHINATSVDDGNISAVPVYVVTMTKDDEMIVTGDNNG